jgi:hypothetical protein
VPFALSLRLIWSCWWFPMGESLSQFCYWYAWRMRTDMGSLNSSKTYRVFGSLHLNLSDKILVLLQWGVWTLLEFVHSESLCDHQVWGDGLVIYQEAPCKAKVGNWASQWSLDLEALLSLPTILQVVWVIGLHTFLLLLFCYPFFHCCLILWNLMSFELSSKWLDRSKGPVP